MSCGRPYNCPDQECQPLCGLSEKHFMKNLEEGDSFICFGRMAEPVVYDAGSVRHDNDLCTCHFTPRVGLTRFFENLDDWRAISDAYACAAVEAVRGLPERSTSTSEPGSENMASLTDSVFTRDVVSKEQSDPQVLDGGLTDVSKNES